jgi:hypothetical protein
MIITIIRDMDIHVSVDKELYINVGPIIGIDTIGGQHINNPNAPEYKRKDSYMEKNEQFLYIFFYK